MDKDQPAERGWSIVDEQLLEEIDLLTRLMVAATSRVGPLPQSEIDHLLEHKLPMQRPKHAD